MIKKIEKLKKERDAVILAHYYVDKEIQQVADYVGDSFYLAQVATKVANKVLIVAGVYFMGESIKILNPQKTVLMLDMGADCPMAHMVTVKNILSMRDKYDDLAVVTYINSTAEIKAYSDICVTSSNAVNIVKKLKEKNIYFIPDKNLGSYIAKHIGDEKNIILNNGYCPIHNKIKAKDILAMKNAHKNAKVLAHPECQSEVINIADYIGSTKGIIESVKNFETDEFIIVTENGILEELTKFYPNKRFYSVENFICADMKKMKIEHVEHVLNKMENEVFVDENLAKNAINALDKMLELGK